jgi:hypothetical protein
MKPTTRNLPASPKAWRENFVYGITAVTAVECGLSTPDELTAETAYT